MKNVEHWVPSKFRMSEGILRASRRPGDVNVRSTLMVDTIAPHYQNAVRSYAHGDILELGCGRVPLYGVYHDLASTVTCVDWEESPHHVGHADLYADLNKAVPLPGQAYDTVILTDVLEHIYTPCKLVAEIHRLLRPGGKAIIATPFFYWVHEAPHDYFRFTESALVRMVGEAGLQVISVEPMGGAPEVFGDLLYKQLARRGRWAGWLLHVYTRLLKTKCAGRVRGRTQGTITLAYLVVAQKS